MKNSLLNIILTISFEKLKKCGFNKKTKAWFIAKSFTHCLQNTFEASNRLGDIIYDQPHNSSFCKKLDSAQYNTILVITDDI